MRMKILSLLVLFLTISVMAYAQSISFTRQITVTTGAFNQSVTLGVNGDGAAGAILDNTFGGDVDVAFGGAYSSPWSEEQAPPTPPPPFDLDVRFLTVPPTSYHPTAWPTGLGGGTVSDFRGYASLAQIDTFRIQMQGTSVENDGVTISWPATLNTVAQSWTIVGYNVATPLAATNMLTAPGNSVTIPAQGGALQVYVIVTSYNAPAVPGPLFAATPNPVDFGSVTVGNNNTQTLTISNAGQTNALTISSINLAGSSFAWVTPPTTPVVVAAGGNTTFQIRYTATVAGPETGSITFTHDAPVAGTTSVVNLQGTATTLVANQLTFSADTVTRADNKTGLQETLSLGNYNETTAGGQLKALQVFVISNQGSLRLSGVSRGSVVANAADWGFATEIANGPINADLSSNDTIKIVIFALSDTVSLRNGTYAGELVNFTYETTDLNADTTWANLHLAAIVASSGTGAALTITADDDQKIRILNQGGVVLGDANNDGKLNILDVLAVVDHILGRRLLTGTNFTRANIAPWGIPDAFVNAQDLALIQSIILAGQYPDGTLLSLNGGNLQFSKSGMGNVELTFVETRNGIEVNLKNDVEVKGLQFDINGIGSLSGNVAASFGSAVSSIDGQTLRSMIYDINGGSVAAGERMVARIPSNASINAADVVNVTVADADNNSISNVVIRVKKDGNTSASPEEFALGAAYPNPFNPSASFSVSVPYASNVTISVYNSFGQLVRTLVDGQLQKGTQVVTWNGLDNNGNPAASGMYIYRMTAEGFSASNSMMLSK